MAMMTVRNLPDEVHQAIRVRAARHGHSAEAEVRAILAEAVNPEGRTRLGSLLAGLGCQVKLTDAELATMTQRDITPATPADFE